MKNYHFEIEPRSVELGDGWQLRLFEDAKEIGGGAFPPGEDYSDLEEGRVAAYADALTEGEGWLEDMSINRSVWTNLTSGTVVNSGFVGRGGERAVISPEEKLRRRQAIEVAKASVELDGFQVSEDYQILVERFINGEIDFKEMTQAVHGLVKQSTK